MSKRTSLLRMVSLAAVAMLTTAAAVAQTRSAIVGTVKDSSGGVLPGVTLTLESPNMVGGAQTSVTLAGGSYRFTDLPPGLYSVTAALEGFKTVKRTELRLAFSTTLTVDLTLSLGALTETITVEGASPVVDVKSSASTQKLDQELLQALPLSGTFRSLRVFEVFTLAPGVTTNRTAHGGARDANNLMLDGVATTIPNRAGIDAAGFGYNWIQEVQVVSLGANAEYGDFSGTISNVIVRSGSDNFSGLADYETTRPSWVGNNTGTLTTAQQVQFKPQVINKQYHTSAQVGGPIKRDKLFFFAGFSYYFSKQIPSGSLGNTARVDHLPSVIGKVNWAISPKVKVEAFVEHDNLNVDNPKAGPLVMPEANYTNVGPKYLWSGRLTWTPSNKTLVEFKNGGLHIYENQEPRTGSLDGPPGHTDSVTGIQSGNIASAFGPLTGIRHVFGGSVTRWAQGFGKSHELKAGIDTERISYTESSNYAGGILYQDMNGQPNQAQLWEGSKVSGTGWRTSIYLQDNWAVTDRLTVQPGVRIALNRGSIPDKGQVFSTNPVSPRIGAAWDVLGDHKTLLRAHYGRFHEALFTTLYSFMDTSQQNPTITAKVLPSGGFQELNRFTPAGNYGIDPGLTHSFTEQSLVALERELFTDFSLTAQYIHRDFQNIFAFIDTGSSWTPVTVQDPGLDGTAKTSDDGAAFTAYTLANPGNAFLQLTNVADAWRQYDAVQLIAKKRFSHNWQAQISYTRSKTEGNVSNAQGANVALAEAGQSGNFTNPNKLINMTGRAVFDSPDLVQVSAEYRIPYLGGVNLSANYRYQSGQPWGRTAVIRGLKQGNETIRIEPRGTRRMKAGSIVDTRLEKTLKFGRRSLGAYLEVFNLGNQGVGGLREASGSAFGTLTSWSTPRQAQVGVRFTF